MGIRDAMVPIRSQILAALSARLRGRPGPLTADAYERRILGAAEGNDLIRSAFESGGPFLAGRLGGVELGALNFYLKYRANNEGGRPARSYPEGILSALQINAGVFPRTDKVADCFSSEWLAALADCNAVAVTYNRGEEKLVASECPDASLMAFRSLEPYYHAEPWSQCLEGMRVLVVHPFVKSIACNYEASREALFPGTSVLPEFELCVVRAVQSQGSAQASFADWPEALSHMKHEMDRLEFDALIVGAGAYGLPLAAHAKRRGAYAIVLGGATQILFGIKGKRWDSHPDISLLFNDRWTRPLAEETPTGFEMIEDGCYW